jgi:hypothetical protein
VGVCADGIRQNRRSCDPQCPQSFWQACDSWYPAIRDQLVLFFLIGSILVRGLDLHGLPVAAMECQEVYRTTNDPDQHASLSKAMDDLALRVVYSHGIASHSDTITVLVLLTADLASSGLPYSPSGSCPLHSM